MEFKRLGDSDSQEFKEAWEIYESSFPSDERRTLKLQKELIKNKKYNFFRVTNKDALVAIICDWNFGDFLFIEHLAVKENFRGKGSGKESLKEYLSKNNKKIVLEVERPENEIAIKRINFYEKNGFKLNAFGYIQPPYGKDKNPVPMFLMSYPKKITEPEFSSIRERLHIVVYGLKTNCVSRNINQI